MIRHLIFCTALLAATAAGAQTYRVDDIPEDFRKDTHAVVRYTETEFIYHSPISATEHYTCTITLLNRNAASEADIAFYTDDVRTLKKFSGAIYNAEGRLIRQIKRSDLHYTEYSASALAMDGGSYFTDITPSCYPCTVHYTYEIAYKGGFISFPSFFPMNSYDTAVERGIYKLVLPDGVDFVYDSRGFDVPERSATDGGTCYMWKLDSLPPFKKESYALPPSERIPYILAAPASFVYEGTEGSLKDWQEYGRWQRSLLDGRNVLPDELKSEVHRLTDSLSSARDKVKAIYDYLGRTTRYVSIQLGIGGLQPMSAEEVYRTKFGDCKALSNYMGALLFECGIPSRYAIIHTKRRRIAPHFAGLGQANHAILQVPLPGDTLWLECTNPELPFGYVHSHIAGHDAILIGDSNRPTQRVTLPLYADSLNRETRNVEITLAEDGSARLSITEEYATREYERLNGFPKRDRNRRTEMLRKDIALPLATIDNIGYEERKSEHPSIKLLYEVTTPRYGRATASRLFLPATPFTRPPACHERKRTGNIWIEAGYVETVTVTVHLPENMTVETLPRNYRTETAFGTFASEVRLEGDTVLVEMQFRLRRGEWESTLLEEFESLLNARASACASHIVLLRK